MSKLKLGAIPDDKPIKLTVELPAAVPFAISWPTPRLWRGRRRR